jgi:tetraacyldisaccharide 4'-kinase
LREPVSSLKRAQVVAITRVDHVERGAVETILHAVKNAGSQCDLVEVTFPAMRLIGASGRTVPLESLAGSNVAAFCGIGNPAAFRTSLEKLGSTVCDFRAFRDHHNYSRADVEELDHWIRALPVDAAVCTQKDLVKIALETLGDLPLWAVEIGTKIVSGREALDARLVSVLSPRSSC